MCFEDTFSLGSRMLSLNMFEMLISSHVSNIAEVFWDFHPTLSSLYRTGHCPFTVFYGQASRAVVWT